MAEDDNTQSLQSRRDFLSPAHSEAPPNNTLTLEVTSPNTGGNKKRGGGRRCDIWNDEATTVLINAWEKKVSEKGHLKDKQWKEMAEIVNNSGQVNNHITYEQCVNKMDTLKKKYKQEKAKNGKKSKWMFFKKLERLIGGTNTSSKSTRKARRGTQKGSVKRSSDSRKRNVSETEFESVASNDSDESQPPKRLKTGESGELAKAIGRFSETYEKMETKKIKQKAELGKERMEFEKDVELKREKFLKPYLEMLKKNKEEEEKRRRRRIIYDDDDDDVSS